MTILAVFLAWYVIIQLTSAAVLPLGVRFFSALPDRGYAFSKILGPFLVGVTLWLGTSYGLLRNDAGGAWLALGVTSGVAYGFGGYGTLRRWIAGDASLPPARRRTIFAVELLFLAAFAVWTWVRVNDPAANHTEQPMDLMFMNSILASPTFPPRDAWLAGYPISYYYLGYWLLTTLGLLSSIPPAEAYIVGQASWYGLLLIGSFGLVYNVTALYGQARRAEGQSARNGDTAGAEGAYTAAGFLAAALVGVIGNLQVILEWLYAQGARVGDLGAWFGVNGFPANAQISRAWYIGYDWWWWRSSRVVSDRDLLGGHIEVIDEFPMFSYILGDNHPHVLAMPVALAVIAMALAVYLTARRRGLGDDAETNVWSAWRRLPAALPMGGAGLALMATVSGGLVFLNTWDYPPYLLLLVAALFAGLATSDGEPSSSRAGRGHLVRSGVAAAAFAVALVAGALALYLPYFLTAQSQAGGFVPNLFNPTRLRQSLLMFGVFLPAIVGWMAWAWTTGRPTLRQLAATGAVVFGLPAAFLAISAALALGTAAGQALLERTPLPDGATYASMMVQRWMGQPFTFLLFGGLVAAALALIWQMMAVPRSGDGGARVDLFVLLLAALGLALVYVPEFVYLRDHFGTRMNTVFKFYYQAWLLLALAAAYAVGSGLFVDRGRAPRVVRAAMTGTLLLAALALIFPAAGATSKTLGFRASPRSVDATQYLANDSPAEKAAAEWVLYNTTPEAVVLEAKGASYNSATNRISSVTGRSTLLGWEGHESQWRGEAFGEMAQGRAEALEGIYRSGSPTVIAQLVARWGIDYVYIGPVERSLYEITPRAEERLSAAMDLVFEDGNVRIYRTRWRR